MTDFSKTQSLDSNLPNNNEKIDLSGAGAAFRPSSSGGNISNTTPTVLKKSPNKKRSSWIVAGFLVLALVVGGFFFLQESTEKKDVPTAPISEPSADEEYPCSLYFSNYYQCSEMGCETSDDCLGDDVCITANDGQNYCSLPGQTFQDACALDPSYASCCESPNITVTPSPTPTELTCGEVGCFEDDDCSQGLVCAREENALVGYCSEPPYIDACRAEPSYESCCDELITPSPTPTGTLTPTPTPTVTPTATPTVTPTATPTVTPTNTPGPTPTDSPQATPTTPVVATATPVVITATSTPIVPTQPPYTTLQPTVPGQPPVYIVDTRTECNDVCSTNEDCDNISHICYNGRCRLDINPEDEYCRTPAGETYVERIVEQPVTGPSDWLNFLKIGIGAIGAGILLFVLLL